MSENSAFWDNEVTGDAASATGWEAPYLSSEKVDILSQLLGSDDSNGYVIPEKLFELAVEAENPASMDISILSGSAFVKGRLYENTTTTSLTIADNASGDPRIDRVILRVSFAAQTIRLVVLAGTPAASPVLPTLTQDANTWEISLAYIWVEDGATSIDDLSIHDEREFLLSFYAVNNSDTSTNHITNSEFIALGNYYHDTDKTDIPAYWDYAYYSSQEPYARPSQMSRGRAIKITSLDPADPLYSDGLVQTLSVKPDTMYSFRSLLQINTGVVGYVSIETDSYAPSTIYKEYRRTGEWLDEHFYYKTEHDATEITFTFSCPLNAGDILYIGQVLAIEGYYPGDYRSFSEVLFSGYSLGSLGRIQNDLHSTETVVWDMDTCDPDFGIYVVEEVKSLLLLYLISDSFDPTTYGIQFRSYAGTDIIAGFTPFDNIYSYLLTKFAEIKLTDKTFEVDYTASGTDTLSASFFIAGMRT